MLFSHYRAFSVSNKSPENFKEERISFSRFPHREIFLPAIYSSVLSCSNKKLPAPKRSRKLKINERIG